MGKILKVLGFFIVVSICVGCNNRVPINAEVKLGEKRVGLPVAAMNVKEVGKDWYTFEWERRIFLLYTNSTGFNSSVFAITELSK